jgi:hypothetical protein
VKGAACSIMIGLQLSESCSSRANRGEAWSRVMVVWAFFVLASCARNLNAASPMS